MRRILCHLLLAAALLFSQHAAMLHGLAHAQHDIALAANDDGNAPALGHADDECVAFFAVGHALDGSSRKTGEFASHIAVAVGVVASPAVPARIAFDSRAPPISA